MGGRSITLAIGCCLHAASLSAIQNDFNDRANLLKLATFSDEELPWALPLRIHMIVYWKSPPDESTTIVAVNFAFRRGVAETCDLKM